MSEALPGGFADSTVLCQHGLRMVTGDLEPSGPAKYRIEDAGAALDLFKAMVEHGGGDLDHSALILNVKRANGPGRG